MGAILGVMGGGSLDELYAMADRMFLRGQLRSVCTPAPGVMLGQCGSGDGAVRRDARAVADSQLENADELSELLASRGRREEWVDDADLLAALVSEFGLEGLNPVRGYFSAAIWDERERSLLLACDQAGFKTLHYAMLPGRIAFTSAYKGLLALPDFSPVPDRDAIQHYLATRNFPLGRAFLMGVRTLLAGEALTCKEGRCEKHRYWQPAVHLVRRTEVEHANAIRRAFLEVVRRQTRPYGRIGLTLSAGLDAPAVLGAVRHVRPEAAVSTFTIGHGEDDPEIVGARAVAGIFRTEHHELTFQPETIVEDLPLLVWLMEDCGAREEALLQLQILREAGKYVRVVMGGHAADAVFGGMPRYRIVRLAEVLPPFRKPLSELYQFTQSGALPTTALGRALKYAIYRGKDYPPPHVLDSTLTARVPWPSGVNEAIMMEVGGVRDFGYLEPAHESANLAFHTPFLDPDFVNLTLSMPGRLKVGLRRQKLILRQAVAGLLPGKIARRPKAIQRVRHDARLSDVLDGMSDKLLTQEKVKKRGFIDFSYVARLRRRPGGAPYPTEQMYRLWTLVCLEIWASQFLDGLGLFPFS